MPVPISKESIPEYIKTIGKVMVFANAKAKRLPWWKCSILHLPTVAGPTKG